VASSCVLTGPVLSGAFSPRYKNAGEVSTRASMRRGGKAFSAVISFLVSGRRHAFAAKSITAARLNDGFLLLFEGGGGFQDRLRIGSKALGFASCVAN
jgi:hypothetical protein